MPKPYDLTTYDGNTVDWLTRAALEATAERLGYDLTVTQGSYNKGGVAASAGTHDGGGVVDLNGTFEADRKVRELRRTGFAAWHRTPAQGDWPHHVHAVLIGNARLSAGARAQVVDYLNGFNGLVGDRPDDGPRDFVRNRFAWPYAPNRITRARALLWEALRANKGERRKAIREALRQLPKR